MFILVVVVLTLIFIVGIKGVSPFITTLFLFLIRLPVFYNNRNYDGLLVVLDIKSGVYNLGGYSIGAYSLSV